MSTLFLYGLACVACSPVHFVLFGTFRELHKYRFVSYLVPLEVYGWSETAPEHPRMFRPLSGRPFMCLHSFFLKIQNL